MQVRRRRDEKVSTSSLKKISRGKGVFALVEEFEIIELTNYEMGIIDLSDRLKDDPYKTIGKLLKGEMIDYLQVNQPFELF